MPIHRVVSGSYHQEGKHYYPGSPDGDTFEHVNNLVPKSAGRLVLVSGNPNPTVQTRTAVEQPEHTPKNTAKLENEDVWTDTTEGAAKFSAMNEDQLIDYAIDNHIDLSGCKGQKEMADTIQASVNPEE